MRPYRLGLTGSIGMGKTTTASMFAAAGIPVFDSDAMVHRLYSKGGAAVQPVSEAFPESIKDGSVSRSALSKSLLQDPAGFEKLNAIIHPLVAEARAHFLDKARADGAELVVFDIPLLFETGSKDEVDGVLVVTAPEAVQRERVMGREGMTEAKFNNIRSRQLADEEKCARADFIIDTSQGLETARKAVHDLIVHLKTATNHGTH
jgi:dephospho-CoA kinase